MKCLFCQDQNINAPHEKKIYIGGYVNSCKGCSTIYYWDYGIDTPRMYNIETVYKNVEHSIYVNTKYNTLTVQKAGVVGYILKLDFIPSNITPTNAATKLATLLVFS